jgi:Cytochrome c554 and c-prime
MEKDDPKAGPEPERNRAMDCPPPRGMRTSTAVAAVLTAAVLAVAGVLLVRWLVGDRWALAKDNEDGSPAGVPLFREWPQPDFVLLLSGQQHGYIQACGCSEPQYGGLVRRYNFLKTLQQKEWPVVALDVGDIPQTKGPQMLPNVQGMLKYDYSMQALKKMGYAAVGIGEYEGALPLTEALAAYAMNEPEPRVLAGNLDRTKNKAFIEATATSRVVDVGKTKLKVGVISVVGPTVAGKIKDPAVHFESVKTTLQGLLPAIEKEKANLKVLLYQGTDAEAKKCAEVFPSLNVILCLSEEDEPSSRPTKVKETMIVSVGHKGKHVGVVGAFAKNGQPQNGFDLRYQMVTLGPEYETPKNEEKDHPIMQLMEQYTKDLKDHDYLAKYPQVNHPLQMAMPPAVPTFVGSERCMKCHEDAGKVWKTTPHAHAYQTLVDDKNPSGRQFDGECIVCHVVGFGYKTGFESLEKTPKLTDVGCESCHGPSSEHAKNPENAAWRKLLNPWKYNPNEDKAAKARRTLQIDQFCQKCHDTDNDVHWDFNKNWPKVEHHTPQP